MPRTDTDFWNSYQQYLEKGIDDGTVNALPLSNSQNDIAKLVANAQALVSQGAKAIVMAPQDTGAIATTLTQLEQKKIPVVTVDTRPDKGNVYMVVRADNRAYGQKACEFLGQKLGGKGKVIEFQGSLSSVNGRDRSEAFAECMQSKFPGITVFAEPTDWEGAKASAALQTRLAQHPDINGIYMQAGGVFLAPTLQVLKSKSLLVPPTDPKHIFVVSNDGIPQEYDSIRKGEIDATVSQPADLYAKYALFYAKAALDGKTFQPGPTDHDSTIVDVGNGTLEDQLAAPLVTKDNVDDKTLWGNQI
jgi:simple sugar transport system substrate-binding protein/ribose transport system substrate-binding protein